MTRALRWAIGVALAASLCLSLSGVANPAATLPSGFQESVVFSGLTNPTNFRFSPDGRIFVAQKNGLILEYPSLTSTTPVTVADLRSEVDDYWDRGLLGLALDPNFPTSPYVYALYTRDAPLGGSTPTWNDACPSPPGPTTDGCVVSGRLVKLTLSGNTAVSTQVLVDGWCQQYPSHSQGDLVFGPDGYLYASSGDGASFTYADFGQGGGSAGSPTVKNPCGDPPAGAGGSMNPPTAEGGALRAQSVRRPAGEPVVLNGSIIRIDPNTGAGAPGNPLAASSDANARRIVAYGMRNPYRFTFRPGTSELWIGDVGWSDWEEIDRVVAPTGTLNNFGWPCYEGPSPQPLYQNDNLNLCTSLYSGGGTTAPYFTWNHANQVVPGEACQSGGSSITGDTFYTGSSYPSSYKNALFFADYTRNCMWVMRPDANGVPDPSQVVSFSLGASAPVDLETGPNGDIFYADLTGGTIRRITYVGGNAPPTVIATASPTSGPAPLTVNFDASKSYDPDLGDTLTYSWDLNGDGVYGDSTLAKPSFTYTTVGTYNARVRITDNHGSMAQGNAIPITVSAPGTGIFGTNTIGSGVDTASIDFKEVSAYTAITGNVTKVTGYLSGLGPNTGSQPVRAVLYADAGGSPGALLGVSDPVTIVQGRAWGWVDFPFASPVAVTAGPIWMGYIASGPSDLTQIAYDPSPGELHYNRNTGGYAAGPTNPFGTASTIGMHYSMYATLATGSSNTPPTASATATPTSGTAPLTVAFDGSGSSDPDPGDTLTYAWDLDGDGAFDDANVAKPSYTYEAPGTFTAKLQVTDSHGASATSAPLSITVSTGGATTGTFGTTTIGTSIDTASADFKEVSKYTAVAGSVTKLTGSQPVRAVIYADSGGNPGALLGVSSPVTTTAGQPWGWVDFPFPAAVTVPAGPIWMGYIGAAANDLTQLRFDPAANELHYNANAGGYAAGPTNPFGTANLASIHYSLYATYTTSNTPPAPTITTPAASLKWKVGDTISFSGGATDAQDGTEPASRLSWDVVLHHCPSTCHTHAVQSFTGVASGSFQAPDHDYPSYLTLTLTATDAAGASASTSVDLQPQTVDLTFASTPTGANLTAGTATGTAPFTKTFIVGSGISVTAPDQTIGGTAYTFTSWSDGGSQTHTLTAPATATTYTATFGTGATNHAPSAVATATPTSGTAPLTVNFDASGSSDPDPGDTITESWDLNGDGTFGDSFAVTPFFTYTTAGTYHPQVRVTDSHGATTTSAPLTITVTAATGGTFGTTTIGSGVDTASGDNKEVSRYTAVAGKVTKLTGYVGGTAKAGPQVVKPVIYADASGQPGALLAVGNAVSVASKQAWGWVDFPFATPVTVASGPIWLGWIGGTKGDVMQMRYFTVTSAGRYNKNSYTTGPSNPFGAATTLNFQYSLYATYTP